MMIRSDMTYNDYLSLFTNEEIFWALYKDDFNRSQFVDEVKKHQLTEMDDEDKLLFNDLHDDKIFTKAYYDKFGADEVIHLMLDSGLSSDLTNSVMEDRGDFYEQIPEWDD